MVPAPLDDTWLAHLDAVAEVEGLALPHKRLVAEIQALSEAYNTGAFARSRTKGALAARLLFFFPRDVPKMAGAVRELVRYGKLRVPEERPLRVLDVGAGLGASTWGLARALDAAGQRGTVLATFVDDDAGALQIARAVIKNAPRSGQVALELDGTRQEGAYDVILVGQSLGEIRADDASGEALLADLVERSLAPDGSLVVVEPALRDRTRRLHRIRDGLVARGVTVFAPCLHQLGCPMLADETAWCHEDLPVDLPRSVAALARAAGLRWQGLTYAYLVLRKDGVTLEKAIGEKNAFRVVSEPIVTKGKRELYLCANGVRSRLARLDRDGTKRDAWASAERGDILVLEPPPGPEDKRLTSSVTVGVSVDGSAEGGTSRR
jgi:ribosomal protein RSM22 (predicted rRNA methylase)